MLLLEKKRMERLLNEEGLTLLQLHKWEPSQLELELSEFREAFISPSRQKLLLLSHHSEALLLPLVAGITTCFSYSYEYMSFAFRFNNGVQFFLPVIR